jgi:blue copper oxidase
MERKDRYQTRWNRRGLGGKAIAAAGVLAVGGVVTPVASAAKGGNAKGGSKGTVTGNPLHVPDTVSPGGLTLTAEPGSVDLGGGQRSNAWLYNEKLPGPTINATRGDRATVNLFNGLSQKTITHWHGLLVDHKNDGHPILAVHPGSSYAYDFIIDQQAGLNWYHPHPHMHTGEQVYMGLAGAFIIRDGVEGALSLPSDRYEVPLIIRDASFDSAGNLTFGKKSSGFLGNTPLVNGTRNAYHEVDRAVYRLRVLNGCNARVLRLVLSNGASFTLIGNDGGLLGTAPVSVPQITLGPAERLDLLVDFRGLSADTSVKLRCASAGWDLLEFRVKSNSGSGTIPTGTLTTIAPLANPVTTREFSFDGMSRINGQVYSLDRIDFQVPYRQTERWRFRTNGNAPHPVHIHGAFFQVQSRRGGRGQVFPWERGWKDTVLLEDKETVEVLIRFDAHKGLYLIHCHQLAHEDNGMMANFEVV